MRARRQPRSDETPQPWDRDAKMLAAQAEEARLVRLFTPRACTPEIAVHAVREAIAKAGDSPADSLDGHRGWLYVVVKNGVIAGNRRAAHGARVEATYCARDLPPEPAEEEVCRRALAAKAADLLDGMPGIGPKALRWQAEGLSLRDIAGMLGTSVKSVDNAMRRTRANVRRALELGVPAPVAGSLRRLRPARVAALAAPAALAVGLVLLPALAPPPTRAPGAAEAAPTPPGIRRVKQPPSTRPQPPRSLATSGKRAVRVVATLPDVAIPARLAAATPGQSKVMTGGKPDAPRVEAPPRTQRTKDPREWLARCIAEGPTITPEYVGCPPPQR